MDLGRIVTYLELEQVIVLDIWIELSYRFGELVHVFLSSQLDSIPMQHSDTAYLIRTRWTFSVVYRLS